MSSDLWDSKSWDARRGHMAMAVLLPPADPQGDLTALSALWLPHIDLGPP